MNIFLFLVGATVFLAVGLLSVLQDLMDRSPHDSPLLGEHADGQPADPLPCKPTPIVATAPLPASPLTL